MNIYIKCQQTNDGYDYEIKLEGAWSCELSYIAPSNYSLLQGIEGVFEKCLNSNNIDVNSVDLWTIEYDGIIMQYKRDNADVFIVNHISGDLDKKYCFLIDNALPNDHIMCEWSKVFQYIRFAAESKSSSKNRTLVSVSQTKQPDSLMNDCESLAVDMNVIKSLQTKNARKNVFIGIVYHDNQYQLWLKYLDKLIYKPINDRYTLDIFSILAECKQLYDTQYVNLILNSQGDFRFRYCIYNENFGIEVLHKKECIAKIKFNEGITDAVLKSLKKHNIHIKHLDKWFSVLKNTFKRTKPEVCKIKVNNNPDGSIEMTWDEVPGKPFYYILYKKHANDNSYSNIRITKLQQHTVDSKYYGYYIILAISINSYIYNTFSAMTNSLCSNSTYIDVLQRFKWCSVKAAATAYSDMVELSWEDKDTTKLHKPRYHIMYRKSSNETSFKEVAVTVMNRRIVNFVEGGQYAVVATESSQSVQSINIFPEYNKIITLHREEKQSTPNAEKYCQCKVTVEFKGEHTVRIKWEACPPSFIKNPIYHLFCNQNKIDSINNNDPHKTFRRISSMLQLFYDITIDHNFIYECAVLAVDKSVKIHKMVKLIDDKNTVVFSYNTLKLQQPQINDEYYTETSKCKHHLWRVSGVGDNEVMLKCNICKDIQFVKSYDFFKNYKLNKAATAKISKPLNSADVIVLSSSKRCTNLNHNIKNYIGVLPVATKNKRENIEVDLGYCKECNIYIMLHSTYNKIQGDPICTVRDLTTNKVLNNANSGFWIESSEHVLHRLGYNVKAGNGMTSMDRQQILAKIINHGVLSKNEIISHLEYCINMASGREHLNAAVSKWKTDLDFVQKFKADSERISVNSLTLKFPK